MTEEDQNPKPESTESTPQPDPKQQEQPLEESSGQPLNEENKGVSWRHGDTKDYGETIKKSGETDTAPEPPPRDEKD